MTDNKSDLEFRAKGYYWVKYGSIWQIMEWAGEMWYKCGRDCGLRDVDLTKIGDRAVRPDANKATLDIQLVINTLNCPCCESTNNYNMLSDGARGCLDCDAEWAV